MSDRTPFEGFPGTWRKQARTLCEHGHETRAVVIESSAAQLEEALRESDEATLTLTAAARESGCSTDRLGRLVREWKIPNAGRPAAPRIAHRHLPRKTGVATGRLAPKPPRCELSTARIVRSVIDRGG